MAIRDWIGAKRRIAAALIAASVAGWLVYLVVDWGFLHNQIVEYQVMCSETLKGYDCPGRWERWTRTVYRVDRDRQVVYEQAIDLLNGARGDTERAAAEAESLTRGATGSHAGFVSCCLDSTVPERRGPYRSSEPSRR